MASETPIPIKVQPSAPRALVQAERERSRWIDWITIGNIFVGQGDFDSLRTWKRQPTAGDAEIIILDAMGRGLLPMSKDVRVKHFQSGAFNILFELNCPDWKDKTTILRISMPYDPWYKTESEVATMMYAARSGVPIPCCLFFDSSGKNPFRLEWMILAKVDKAISLQVSFNRDHQNNAVFNKAKAAGHILLRDVAKFSRNLEATKFDKIGSLYYNWDDNLFYVGPIVDTRFLGKYTYRFSIGNRGPFKSCQDYLQSILQTRHRAGIYDGAQATDANTRMAIQLRACASFAFGAAVLARFKATAAKYEKNLDPENGPFHGSWAYVQHDDLHMGNVLIRPTNCGLASLIDWEQCKILPPFLRRNHGIPKLNDDYHKLGFRAVQGTEGLACQISPPLVSGSPREVLWRPSRLLLPLMSPT
ncbi:unnamed protein product [Parascedosporium putredinis]|uniref:Aminoglycoside phosphotransferase domain-containing protein n=1 Tax=Parascedosporium putredinis TaxID=1442378 RepID=A0A9P1MCZ8_9PEZI|nr:unnamed protein product [Parascedosporium putredinis]CAI7997766.1 unnamed protein product [Parascedosporium putredinis]